MPTKDTTQLTDQQWIDGTVRKMMALDEGLGDEDLKEFVVPVSKGVPVIKAEEAEAAANELGGPLWVVKSQIQDGARVKGNFNEASAGDKGGVRLAKTNDEVKEFS